MSDSPAKTHVLSLQTTLLGNKTYGELLRRAFADSSTLEFEAHWSDESREAHAHKPFERQLDRVFLKMIENPAIRTRNLDFFPLRYELGTSYWARRTLAPLLRTRTPDVLHVHTQAIALLSLDVMARIPTVVSADGTSVQMAAQQLAPPWRWTFGASHAFERAIFRRAAAVTTFSAVGGGFGRRGSRRRAQPRACDPAGHRSLALPRAGRARASFGGRAEADPVHGR